MTYQLKLVEETGSYIEISSDFAGGTFNGTEYESASEYTDSDGNTNTKVYDLEEWISTTINNGGYYIARYEASKNGEKAASKVSIGTPATSSSTTIEDGMLWNFITQPDASTAAKAMYAYSENAEYYSDLINSYAWDTAIIFIEAYSGNNTYSTKTGVEINTSLVNTGLNNDKVCNIHDMAGNVAEWTTETCIYSDYVCTYRGGNYSYDFLYTRKRWSATTSNNAKISFRALLYVNCL